jgi:hypothetical protein
MEVLWDRNQAEDILGIKYSVFIIKGYQVSKTGMSANYMYTIPIPVLKERTWESLCIVYGNGS